MAPCAGRRITCCVTPSLPSNASWPNDISHSTGASPDNPHYILTKIHLRTANLWATHSKPNKLAPVGAIDPARCNRMKILFIVPYVPSLVRVRPYNLIRHLTSLGHEVTVVTVWTNEQERAEVDELRKHSFAV